MKLQIEKLFGAFDKLQKKYGDKNLTAIYGAGKIKEPEIVFVFMNPTAKNVSTSKNWKGLKAPWIGTKNVWRMFYTLGFLDKDIFEEIISKKAQDWDYDFSEKVYKHIKDKSIYITNLSKATKIDSKNPPNSEFKDYLDLFKEEIKILKPKVIITFGNQVSSVILDKNIKVSENRKKDYALKIGNKEFKFFPVYYPVGQGQRNISKAKEDLEWILNKNIK